MTKEQKIGSPVARTHLLWQFRKNIRFITRKTEKKKSLRTTGLCKWQCTNSSNLQTKRVAELTFKPSTCHQPQHENDCKDDTGHHQFKSEVLKPHFSPELPALSLETICLRQQYYKKDVNLSFSFYCSSLQHVNCKRQYLKLQIFSLVYKKFNLFTSIENLLRIKLLSL